jgi:hypothetical protein
MRHQVAPLSPKIAWVAACLTAAAGCATNPCAGKAGVCIGVHVEGTAKGLDQLALTLAGQTVYSPNPPQAFSLPARVAVFPPAGAQGPQMLLVDGLSLGAGVAHAVAPVTVPASGSVQVTVTLNSGTGVADGGALDGATPDLASTDLAGCVPRGCGPADVGMIVDCGAMVDCGPPRLYAATPEVANTGDDITLHGHFAPGAATVTFPGGLMQAAKTSDPTRVIVTVPFGATAGNITVTSGGLTSNGIVFRSASFALGLKTFRPNYDQGAYARLTPQLPTGRTAPVLVRAGGYLFVIGGQDTSGTTSTSVQALINADSTIGSFVDTGQNTVAGRRASVGFNIGNRLYLIGGNDSTGANLLDSVETATVNASGALSPWADAGVHLTTARGGAAHAIIGGAVYVFGGAGLASVEQAPINADGTLGAFTDAGVTLTNSRFGAHAFVVGQYVYVAGGIGSAGYVATIDKAPINADGTLGPFVDAGIALAAPRAFYSAAHLGSRLYVISGRDASGVLSSIEESVVPMMGGAPGNFAVKGNIAPVTPRISARAMTVGNYLYVVGGINAQPLPTLELAQINASGAIGAFASAGVNLTMPRWDHAIAVIGDSIYMLGGRGGAGTMIERFRVHPDGSLSASQTLPATPLSATREFTTCAVTGGWINVVGGENGVAAPSNSWDRATIALDGSVGSFSDSGQSLGGTRSHHALFTAGIVGVFATGGQTYAAGPPATNPALMTTVYSYAQGTNNAFGSFNTGSYALPTTRNDARTVTLSNFVYLLGGDAVAIEQASLNLSASSLGTWGPNGSLNVVRNRPSTLLIADQLYVFGGWASGIPINSYERATVAVDGTLGTFAIPPGTSIVTGGISNHTSAMIGNYVYTFGGVIGGSSTDMVLSAPLQ